MNNKSSVQSDSISTTCGSNSTGSWKWIWNDTCIPADDITRVSSPSARRRMALPVIAAGNCSGEASSHWSAPWIGRWKSRELSGVGEASAIALPVMSEDLLCSGTVAIEKVWVSPPASHCPQHTSRVSVVQLRSFLFNSVLTCSQKSKKVVPLVTEIYIFFVHKPIHFLKHLNCLRSATKHRLFPRSSGAVATRWKVWMFFQTITSTNN